MRALGVAAALAAGCGASAASAEPSAGFGGWWSVCSVQRTCWAFGFPEEVVDQGFVRVTRGGGGTAEPVVLLAAARGEGTKPARSVTLRVSVDGAPELRLPPLRAATGNEEYGPFEYFVAEVTEPAAVRALLAAMRKGSVLRLRPEGHPEGRVSLKGASAALLWMDEQQKRVGTNTALVRAGARPASSVPAVPALRKVRAARPVSQARLPAAFPAAMRGNADLRECLQMEKDIDRKTDMLVARLGGGKVLWGIGCGHGAYNMNYAMWIGDERGRGLKPARLVDGERHVVNPGFDAETMTLSTFAKGRGIGDCGSAETWVWDGRSFVPVDELVMGDCRAVPWDYWPELKRAEVVR